MLEIFYVQSIPLIEVILPSIGRCLSCLCIEDVEALMRLFLLL